MNKIKSIITLLLCVAVLPVAAEETKASAEKQKIVLVLGSGGSRGLAHVGAIEELEKMGIVPDFIVGCSSGAFVGALYAQHGDIAKVKEIMINLKADDLVKFTLFQRYAVSSTKKVEAYLDKHLTVKDFKDLKIPFIAVVTDLEKGEPVYLKEGKIAPAVIASTALPGLFPPHKIKGKIYVDGGICDPLPVHFSRSLADNVLVIASDISPALDGFDITNLPQVVRKSFEVLYQRLAHFERKDADLLLDMNFKDIDSSPLHDGANQEIYERGKEIVLSISDDISKKILRTVKDEAKPSATDESLVLN